MKKTPRDCYYGHEQVTCKTLLDIFLSIIQLCPLLVLCCSSIIGNVTHVYKYANKILVLIFYFSFLQTYKNKDNLGYWESAAEGSAQKLLTSKIVTPFDCIFYLKY